MNLLIRHQNTLDVKYLDAIKQGTAMAIDKLATIGFKLDVSYALITKKLISAYFQNDTTGDTMSVIPTDIISSDIPTGYKIVCLVFDALSVTPNATNPVHHPVVIQGATPIQIPVQWFSDTAVTPTKIYPEVFCQYFLHEIAHALCFFSKTPDKVHTHYLDPIFSQKTAIEYYIHLINEMKPFWPSFETQQIQQGYKFFSKKEVETFKLLPEVWSMLDTARGIAGVPFALSSGLRTTIVNEKAGGVEDSAHLGGYAADIKCNDSSTRMKMVSALLQAGFKRIGIGNTFIHADCDPSKPQNVMWNYY